MSDQRPSTLPAVMGMAVIAAVLLVLGVVLLVSDYAGAGYAMLAFGGFSTLITLGVLAKQANQ